MNNIFDLSGGALLGLYQNWTTTFGMNGNTFTNNIVYFANNAAGSLWQAIVGSGDAVPTDTTNLYYEASGAAVPNSGKIVDANPVYANPQFADPSEGNYSMPPTSPAYALIRFQPLPTDHGPLP
jgi:hypothetical protein